MRINPVTNVKFGSGIIKNVPLKDFGSPGISSWDIDTAEVYKIKGRQIKLGDGSISCEIAEDPEKFVALYRVLEKMKGEDISVDYYGREINI